MLSLSKKNARSVRSFLIPLLNFCTPCVSSCRRFACYLFALLICMNITFFLYVYYASKSLSHCITCADIQLIEQASSSSRLNSPAPQFLARSSSAPYNFYINTANPSHDVFVSKHILQYGTWEPHIEELFISLLPTLCTADTNNIVVDVGANVGYFSLLAARIGCTVAAYEVQQNLIELITNSIHLNNFKNRIALHHNAVMERGGIPMNIFIQSADNFGSAMVYEGAPMQDKPTDKVFSVSLDEEFQEFLYDPTKKIVLLKVDVEGNEPSVLNGAKELMKMNKIQNIVLETRYVYKELLSMLINEGGYVKVVVFEEPSFIGTFLWKTSKRVTFEKRVLGDKLFDSVLEYLTMVGKKRDIWLSKTE